MAARSPHRIGPDADCASSRSGDVSAGANLELTSFVQPGSDAMTSARLDGPNPGLGVANVRPATATADHVHTEIAELVSGTMTVRLRWIRVRACNARREATSSGN
jgi:hypothetical protein